jgi:hypothetical protein
MRPGHESVFRRWLVDKVKRSRWVTYASDDVETVAQRIGVQPDVLRQAQSELEAERQADGRPALVLGSSRLRPRKQPQLGVDMPKEVFEDWQLYCKTRDLPGGVIVRSLIHTLLSGPENPTWIGRRWRYRGRTLKLTGYKYAVGWPYKVKTKLSFGASRALALRAQSIGCNVAALIRGAVIDLLEGRTKRLNIITSADAMWEDENRYWLGRPPSERAENAPRTPKA